MAHFLFAFSTLGFFLTIVAMYQRRVALWHLGGSPQWAGVTFPFVNTALAAGLYRRVHPEYPVVLTVWVVFLSIIAFVCVVSVDMLYIRKAFFAMDELHPTTPTTREENPLPQGLPPSVPAPTPLSTSRQSCAEGLRAVGAVGGVGGLLSSSIQLHLRDDDEEEDGGNGDGGGDDDGGGGGDGDRDGDGDGDLSVSASTSGSLERMLKGGDSERG